MKTSQVPVLVVGGGAAGTMLSLELARHGVEVRTVDRAPGPAATSKAITVHARTVEIFERIDRRLAARFLHSGIHNHGYVLHFVDDAGQRSEVRPGLDFTTLDSRYPFMLIHGQSDTERYLREYLSAEYGRATQWGVECVDVEHRDAGVRAMLRDADGELEQVECRYLVACDGMNSRVRRSLGLVQDETDYAGTKMQNMDVFLQNFPDVDDYIHYCAGTDHFIMIAKLPGGFYRLLLSDRGEAADPNTTPQRAFLNLVDRHFDGVTLGDIVWHSKWESWVRLAHTYRDRNVFLAGDSAHVHSTTGGQGMNCCIQDAWNLGWKLGYVVRGDAPAGLLDSYERERRPIAEQVIWAASSLHEIFMGHGKSITERRTRMNDPAFLDAVIGRCSGVSYTYRDSVPQAPEATELHGPLNGDRVANVELEGGGWLLESTSRTNFTLLALCGEHGPSAELTARLDRIGGRYGTSLVIAKLPRTPALDRYFGAAPTEQLVLIRPDAYLGYRCAAADSDELDNYLASRLSS